MKNKILNWLEKNKKSSNMYSIRDGKYSASNKFGDYTDLVNEYLNQIYDRSLNLYAL